MIFDYMADAVANVFDIVSTVRCHWLMNGGDVVTTVKAYLADVIAICCGCCYCHFVFFVADVVPLLVYH